MGEQLTFVDEDDHPIGIGDRKEAWANGYYTRNIRVVIRDENGKFLSQKRSIKKESYPGLWTVAASGHVDAGEDWDEAALRETDEEIGVSTPLKLLGHFSFEHDDKDKKIRQIVHLYEGILDSKTQFVLDKNEVDDIKWYDLEELKVLMYQTPDKFTPSFKETVNMFY